MKFNNSYNGADFSEYILYLKSIKRNIPISIYDFASDINRHNFEKQSLHDSWLKEVEIKTDFDKRFSNIDLVLLGAYHDREFHLSFKEVQQYKINKGLQDIDRDLITFEIGIETNCYNEQQIIFRAEFSGDGDEIEIYCNKMKIDEIMLTTTNC